MMIPANAIQSLRRDFPIFSRLSSNRAPLCYLDTANSAQKPQVMIDTIQEFYSHEYGNIHRGLYELSQRSTLRFEQARETVRAFLGASRVEEIIFTRGTTEALNLVANAFGSHILKEGDTVLVSEMEHHANIVPWQLVAKRVGAHVVKIPLLKSAQLDLVAYEDLLKRYSPRIIAVTHVSNALGTINPVAELCRMAHAHGAYVVVDGTQAAPHLDIDVQDLGCDFYAFSGHKVYGPTGIGALFGKYPILEDMPPYHGGGDMIETVSFQGTTYKGPPTRFEAGTPPIAQALGLASSLDYLTRLDIRDVAAHEHALYHRVRTALKETPGLRFLSADTPNQAPLITYVIDGVHAQDYATLLDQRGVALRVGHHCTQPTLDVFGVSSAIRVSFGLYNNEADCDQFLQAHQKALQLLR